MDAPLLPDEVEDPTPSRVWDSHMENPNPPPSEEPSFVWDWGNLLDFSIDDPSSIISWDSDDLLDNPGPSIAPPEEGSESVPPVPVSDRVRKRDPRLICENFLAGRVPCACPELDEKEEEERVEEEEEGIGRKRARIGSKSVVRCQVPACEADITALKGYHRRHRVCLRCANATLVVLDGQHKRYCQQCGKFHLLPDFDEGKRSCRRKLERHNNRRRRKSAGSQNAVEKESPENLLADDVGYDGEIAKEMLNGVSSASDSLSLGNHLRDTEAFLENEDQHGSPSCLLSSFENTQSNNNTSFTVSNKTQREPATINSKTDFSSTFRGNKSTYSSVCPTGRISFKLYDWNPAEFPRRLRHQIFQWLASMPVELEGYIRPGCTILTLFIAMPRFMWEKLSEDGASYLRALVDSPESLLSRRGAMFIHLNNTMFQVLRDGTSLMSIKLEVRVPKIHHVHPNFFEAGKPIVFVACGSNLSQPNLRFLISFAGKYLVYDSCLAIPQRKISICGETKEDSADVSDHEMFKICIPHTEANIFGPAFVEVENESGLSNFIPVLFGDGAICAELQILQQGFDESLCSTCCETKFLDCPDLSPDSGKVLDCRHTKMSELLLDIAWLLKDFELDKIPTHLTVIQIKRLNYLLNFLIVKESAVLLERILPSLKSAMDAKELSNAADGICVTEMSLLRKNMDQARQILNRRRKDDGNVLAHTENIDAQVALSPLSGVESEVLYTKPYFCQDAGARKEDILKPGQMTASPRTDKADPVVNRVVIMNLNDCPRLLMGFGGWPCRTYGQFFAGTIMRTRLLVFLVVTFVTCFGICAVLSHPHKVGEFAVTIRRCLFFDLEP